MLLMAMSKTGYYGVSYHVRMKRYFATIGHQGKSMHLGCYETAWEAALAYNAKAIELRGHDCPRLNFRKKPQVPDGAVAVDLNAGNWAIVDESDYERVRPWKWTVGKVANGGTCAVSTIDGKKVQMHRFLKNAPRGVEVDHRDRDPFNNRQDNLRFCTKSQNCGNRAKGAYKRPTSSRFKGVCRLKNGNWRASIMCRGKVTTLGEHKSEETAARAYDAAAIRLFGEFACVNFPPITAGPATASSNL